MSSGPDKHNCAQGELVSPPCVPHRGGDGRETRIADGAALVGAGMGRNELWIDDRKLYPGDYHRREAGTVDQRVCSETGCTCVLVTSSRDFLL